MNENTFTEKNIEENLFSPEAALDMIYLCGCVLTGQVPERARLDAMDLPELYRISKFHYLAPLVSEGLELGGYQPSEENREYIMALRMEKERSVRKNLMFDLERGKLLAFLEERGIWYMPLKGVVLKDLYPKLGLRQMMDNDILFDESGRETVRDWFISQGYRVESYCKGDVDVYQKEPFYNYEMHTALFSGKLSPAIQEYYAEVGERLVPCENTRFGRRFTVEEFYCYFIAHGYKHYSYAGIGMRFLFDLYVYLKKYGDSMDFAYVKDVFERMGITEFAESSRSLMEAVFADIQHFTPEKLTEEQRKTLFLSLGSGVYGTLEQSVTKGVARHGGKGKYLLWRFFPGTDVLSKYHSMFRHRWLMPVGWIYRWGKSLTDGRGAHVVKELTTAVTLEKKDE